MTRYVFVSTYVCYTFLIWLHIYYYWISISAIWEHKQKLNRLTLTVLHIEADSYTGLAVWEILPISYLVMTIWPLSGLYTCPCLQQPLCWRWEFVNVIYFISVWSKYFVLVFLDITATLLVSHHLFRKILDRIMKSIKAYFENLLNILEIVSWLDTQFHHSTLQWASLS